MPKIVDHEAYSRELAQKAARYFSDHGYAGASMRGIAAYLGLSKSALYHYFPTKDDLFLACTRQVMAGIDASLADPDLSEAENLARLEAALRAEFASELALVVDYLRGKSPEEIAADEAMQLSLQTYRRAAAAIAGEDRAEEILAELLGRLMLDYMSGR